MYSREMHEQSELVFAYPPNASPDKIEVAVYHFNYHPPKKK